MKINRKQGLYAALVVAVVIGSVGLAANLGGLLKGDLNSTMRSCREIEAKLQNGSTISDKDRDWYRSNCVNVNTTDGRTPTTTRTGGEKPTDTPPPRTTDNVTGSNCDELKVKALAGDLEARKAYLEICERPSGDDGTTPPPTTTGTGDKEPPRTGDSSTTPKPFNCDEIRVKLSQNTTSTTFVPVSAEEIMWFKANCRPRVPVVNPRDPKDNREQTGSNTTVVTDKKSDCSEFEIAVRKYSGDMKSQDYLIAEQRLAICENGIAVADPKDRVAVNIDREKSPCKDVDSNTDTAKRAFELYRRGAISCNDGKFDGEAKVSRAMLAKILSIVRDGTVEKSSNTRFKDVTGSAWFKDYIEKLAQAGAINGFSNGTVKPDRIVTTAEFLKIFGVFFNLKQNLPYSYKDVPSTVWFAPFAGLAEKYKLFDYSVNTTMLEPAHELNKREVVGAIYQYLINQDL